MGTSARCAQPPASVAPGHGTRQRRRSTRAAPGSVQLCPTVHGSPRGIRGDKRDSRTKAQVTGVLGPDLKIVRRKRLGGSNPSPSAKNMPLTCSDTDVEIHKVGVVANGLISRPSQARE